MFTALFGYFVTKVGAQLVGRFPMKAETIAKWVVGGALVLILSGVILFAGWWVQGCLIDRKIEQTNQAIDKLKVEEKKIEAKAKAENADSERKEIQADIAEKKSDAAVRAAKEIAKEKNVSLEEAMKNLCAVYPEAEGCPK